MIGVAAGWLLAARVSEDAVRLAVGVISIAFVAYMLIRDRLGLAPVATPGVPTGLLWGSLAGFTSFISHAGAPPFQVYVMPQNLKPRVFAGTATMFFAAVNLIKFPPYLLLGQFSRENLSLSALLIPVAVVATYAGVWLVRACPCRQVLRHHPRDHLSHRRQVDLRCCSGARVVRMTVDPEPSPIHACRTCPTLPAWQLTSFAAVGAVGYVVDSCDHLRLRTISRPVAGACAPARLHRRHHRQFSALNRAITFRDAGAPLVRAFLRYWLVASAGLAVNFAVYSACVFLAPRFGVAVKPGILPLFVAAGVAVSMIVTFAGFRVFAFRP